MGELFCDFFSKIQKFYLLNKLSLNNPVNFIHIDYDESSKNFLHLAITALRLLL